MDVLIVGLVILGAFVVALKIANDKANAFAHRNETAEQKENREKASAFKGRQNNITAIQMLFGVGVVAAITWWNWNNPSETTASAATYTPAELRDMVDSGSPPKQGSPTTKTQDLAFTDCVAKVEGIVDSVKAQYPAKVMVNSGALYMAKVWTNDATMTMSCSQPDSKLIITNAAYL